MTQNWQLVRFGVNFIFIAMLSYVSQIFSDQLLPFFIRKMLSVGRFSCLISNMYLKLRFTYPSGSVAGRPGSIGSH